MWKTLALSAGFALVTSAAAAQPQCNERHTVLELLATKYSETPVATGVTNSGRLVQVLTNARDGNWTLIMTTPQGMSCFVAAGEGWRTREPIEPVPEGMAL